MRSTLRILRGILEQLINDIDCDNTYVTEAEEKEIIDLFQRLNDPPISKYDACRILDVKKSRFGQLMQEGKIPHGKKRPGFNELSWSKKDLYKYLKEKEASNKK